MFKWSFAKKPLPLFIVIAIALAGSVIGLGGFTFIYGRGYSYLSDDPKACVNCHIMQDQYDSWQRSPHRQYTTCNSCHTPENIFLKYFVKAENGMNHAYKFTTGSFNDPIQIRPHNFNITMKACLNCHGQIFSDVGHQAQLSGDVSCVHCHKDVGHFH